MSLECLLPSTGFDRLHIFVTVAAFWGFQVPKQHHCVMEQQFLCNALKLMLLWESIIKTLLCCAKSEAVCPKRASEGLRTVNASSDVL